MRSKVGFATLIGQRRFDDKRISDLAADFAPRAKP
jgi:hypothetical protein